MCSQAAAFLRDGRGDSFEQAENDPRDGGGDSLEESEGAGCNAGGSVKRFPPCGPP